MPALEAQVSFPMFTNLPRDVITNTFHFQSDAISDAAAAALIGTRLGEFYNDVFTGGTFAASYVQWTLGRVKVFNMADPTPRVPIIEVVSPIPLTSSSTNVPTEVAVVLSYHADYTSGDPAGRLRNRIYIGGLANDAINNGDTSNFPTVKTTFRNQLATAFQTLVAANGAGLEIVQRSRVGLITSRPIVGGWVDNTPDTQRRRGVAATTRTTFST